MSATRRARVFCLLVAGLPASALTDPVPPNEPGCLYVNDPSQPQPFVGCEDDPIGLARDPRLVVVRKFYKIQNYVIEFKGCLKGRFQTSPLRWQASGGSYRIYYVIKPGTLPEYYLAPIAHEFAHVVQFQDAGSVYALIQKYTVRKVELEADFLAGVALRQLDTNASLGDFEHNLNMTGNYQPGDPMYHGCPEDRVAAFRNGYFLNADSYEGNVEALRNAFQDDLLPELEEGTQCPTT